MVKRATLRVARASRCWTDWLLAWEKRDEGGDAESCQEPEHLPVDTRRLRAGTTETDGQANGNLR